LSAGENIDIGRADENIVGRAAGSPAKVSGSGQAAVVVEAVVAVIVGAVVVQAVFAVQIVIVATAAVD
jgi:hypothetical protein